CIERSVALTSYEQLVVDDLPERVRSFREEHVLVTGSDPEELVPLEEVERRYVLRVLDASGGNKTIAARVLGLDRKTLHRKLERWAQSSQDEESGSA
ncbi:MAG TPA: helix-turn-helix domain-containing protein, partial [Myxococcota bacterium]|nr:helix-turn-helix domain-containing protein [Myxococcota bacterium]